MLCIVYVIAVGTCLGIVGVLVERMMPATSARRWVWCVIIPLSIALPGIYRSQHAAVVGAALDPGWWVRIESFDPIIGRLSLIASAVLLIWALANAWRVSRMAGQPPRSPIASMVDGIPVVITDTMGPATVGVLRSLVLIPQWVLALPKVERQYVLRHEEEHRRANDARLLFIASLAVVVIPWNIALWWQLRRLSLAVEMDCDNRVVRALGNAPAYGELLFKVAQASSRGPRLQPALLGGVGTLERRLTALLAPTPLRHVQRFLLPAMAFGLLILVLSMPHPVHAHGSHSHSAMTSSITAVATR